MNPFVIPTYVEEHRLIIIIIEITYIFKPFFENIAFCFNVIIITLIGIIIHYYEIPWMYWTNRNIL